MGTAVVYVQAATPSNVGVGGGLFISSPFGMRWVSMRAAISSASPIRPLTAHRSRRMEHTWTGPNRREEGSAIVNIVWEGHDAKKAKGTCGKLAIHAKQYAQRTWQEAEAGRQEYSTPGAPAAGSGKGCARLG